MIYTGELEEPTVVRFVPGHHEPLALLPAKATLFRVIELPISVKTVDPGWLVYVYVRTVTSPTVFGV